MGKCAVTTVLTTVVAHIGIALRKTIMADNIVNGTGVIFILMRDRDVFPTNKSVKCGEKMICGNCGEPISGVTHTNQCPKCRAEICPTCGCRELDPLAVMPKDENDTVGLVFGFKPYWKCRKCNCEFKSSSLIRDEDESASNGNDVAEDFAIMGKACTMLFLVVVVILLLTGIFKV